MKFKKYLFLLVVLAVLSWAASIYSQDLKDFKHDDGFNSAYTTVLDSTDFTFDFRHRNQTNQESKNNGFAQYIVFVDTLHGIGAYWIGDSLVSIYGKPLYENPMGNLVSCSNDSLTGVVLQSYRSCAWDTLFQNKQFFKFGAHVDHDAVVEIPLAIPPSDGYLIRVKADSIRLSHKIKMNTALK